MPKTVEEIYEEARKMIGVETPVVKGRYPVEYDPIRRHCHMIGDTNPLFLDPEYASQTKNGAVLCPPPMVIYFADRGVWPPVEEPSLLEAIPTAGKRAINLTLEAEWFKPVKVGDQLYVKQRVADIYVKPIKLDPKAFWFLIERVITNQNGEVVCVERNLGLKHRSQKQIQAAQEAGEE